MPDHVGLTNLEAKRRLVQYGPNEPAVVRRHSEIVQFVSLFANPLISIVLTLGDESLMITKGAPENVITLRISL